MKRVMDEYAAEETKEAGAEEGLEEEPESEDMDE